MKEEAIRYGKDLGTRRPELQSQIQQIIDLMNEEIAAGESEANESELALDELKVLEEQEE